MERMEREEMLLARRILEAGRTIAKEELLDSSDESRSWFQELREAVCRVSCVASRAGVLCGACRASCVVCRES